MGERDPTGPSCCATATLAPAPWLGPNQFPGTTTVGTPERPEDRASNLQWAVQLVTRFKILRDREWARICRSVLAEARAAGVAVPAEQQTPLCDVLASVDHSLARSMEQIPALAEAGVGIVRVNLRHFSPGPDEVLRTLEEVVKRFEPLRAVRV